MVLSTTISRRPQTNAPAAQNPTALAIETDQYARTSLIRGPAHVNGPNHAPTLTSSASPFQRASFYAFKCARATTFGVICGALMANLPAYGTQAISNRATGIFIIAVGVLIDTYNWRNFLRKNSDR